MHVTALELVDFRCYAQVQLDLEPGVSVLVGRNGQGKTNVVEAIGYLATLGSHRVATDAPLVRHGADRAVVRAAVVRDGRRLLLEAEIVPGKSNRARINKSPLARSRELLGVLRAVVFAPEDLSLVRGEPDGRRAFLDALLAQLTPRLAGVKADYDRVLKQRNSLLRSAVASRAHARGSVDTDTLAVWDEHLVRLGAELLEARLALVDDLQAPVTSACTALAPHGGTARLEYKASWAASAPVGGPVTREVLAAALAAALERVRQDELQRGVTLVGPHRDDLVLLLGDHPAKGYASHGEGWSLALALRLASFALLRRDGDDPVLVLDDVFAELDTGRRTQLAAMVQDAEQVLVTAAVAEDIPPTLSGARFVVDAGQVWRDQ